MAAQALLPGPGSVRQFGRPAWAGLGFHFGVSVDRANAPTNSVFVGVQRTRRQGKRPAGLSLVRWAGLVRQGKRSSWAASTSLG